MTALTTQKMETKGPRGFFTLLFLLSINTAYSDHTLRYYHTTVSSPDHEMPQYTSVGYVDGIQITRYSSDTGRSVPVAHWMERLEPEYWEEETQNNKQAQEASRRNVKIAMSRYNHTAGFHSFQDMYGCELRDDGSTRGYWQFGYGGNDFLTLDTERWVYYPITDQAQVSAQKLNDLKARVGERAKDYLEKDCIKWLETYMEYGKEELDRKVHPQVKVSSHQSGSTMKLHCQVNGFYPRDVDVNWMKNEIDYILPYEAKRVLPNSDGTYQTRVKVEVTPEDGASYFCYVDHSSLNETMIIMLDGGKPFTLHYWIISSITVSGIVIAVCLFCTNKKCSGCTVCSSTII